MKGESPDPMMIRGTPLSKRKRHIRRFAPYRPELSAPGCQNECRSFYHFFSVLVSVAHIEKNSSFLTLLRYSNFRRNGITQIDRLHIGNALLKKNRSLSRIFHTEYRTDKAVRQTSVHDSGFEQRRLRRNLIDVQFIEVSRDTCKLIDVALTYRLRERSLIADLNFIISYEILCQN